jgi:amino acid transporter
MNYPADTLEAPADTLEAPPMPDAPAVDRAPVDEDAEYLRQFGYEQQLHRRLNLFSTFAAGFSYMSPTTGIFGLFALGLAAVGGALIWVWPIAFLGQLLVALTFAEISTHYPLAGSVFQWTKYFSRSKAYAWFTGWIYLFAGVLTTAGVVATLPLVLTPMLDRLGIGIHLSDSLGTQQTIALISIAVYTLLNAVGVKVVALINNSAVIFEALGLLVFAVILALFHHHHGVEVYTDTGGAGFTGGAVLVALFVGLWVMYGFDTASTLAEESVDPRRNAPRSIIGALTAAFVTGGIFIAAMLVAVPGSINDAVRSSLSPVDVISGNLSNALTVAYLGVIVIAVFATCLAIQASTIRLAFGLARDRQLPGSRFLSAVNDTTGTPIGCCVTVGLLTSVFFLQYGGVAYVVIAGTGMTFLAYLLCNVAVLRGRLRGWPRKAGKFSLGRWGLALNVLAVIWGVAMVANLYWHRPETNPKPDETSGALHFGIGFLNSIPVQWLVLGVVTLLGVVYYALRNRHLPSPLLAPGRDDVTDEERALAGGA